MIYICVMCVYIYLYVTLYIYIRIKYDISNTFNFQQSLLFAHSSSHRCNSATQISAVTWGAVHEHIIAGTCS